MEWGGEREESRGAYMADAVSYVHGLGTEAPMHEREERERVDHV